MTRQEFLEGLDEALMDAPSRIRQDNLRFYDSYIEEEKRKGRTEEEARAIEEAAKFVESVGCFETVLEHIPEELGTKITNEINIPTIGIGGGKFTDGHVLVMHDALGMHPNKIPPFATKFADMYSVGVQGLKRYIESVNARV